MFVVSNLFISNLWQKLPVQFVNFVTPVYQQTQKIYGAFNSFFQPDVTDFYVWVQQEPLLQAVETQQSFLREQLKQQKYLLKTKQLMQPELFYEVLLFPAKHFHSPIIALGSYLCWLGTLKKYVTQYKALPIYAKLIERVEVALSKQFKAHPRLFKESLRTEIAYAIIDIAMQRVKNEQTIKARLQHYQPFMDATLLKEISNQFTDFFKTHADALNHFDSYTFPAIAISTYKKLMSEIFSLIDAPEMKMAEKSIFTKNTNTISFKLPINALKKIIFASSFFYLPLTKAQSLNNTFFEVFGGSALTFAEIRSVYLMPDNGTMAIGNYESSNMIAKFSVNGTVEWAKSLSFSYLGGGYLNNNFKHILVGSYGNDMSFCQLSLNGTVESAISISGGGSSYTQARAAHPTQTNGTVLVGYTTGFGAVGEDVLVVRLSANRTVEWARKIGGAGDERAYGVHATPDDGSVWVGYTTSAGAGNKDILTAKFSSNGTLVWMQTLGGSSVDEARDAYLTSDQGTILTGSCRFNNNQDVFIAKIASNGTVEWTKALGVNFFADYGYKIYPTVNEDMIIAGTSVISGGSNILVAQINHNLTLDWSTVFGPGASLSYTTAHGTPTGDIVVAGGSNGFRSTEVLFIARLNANGAFNSDCNPYNATLSLQDISPLINTTLALQVDLLNTNVTTLTFIPSGFLNFTQLPCTGTATTGSITTATTTATITTGEATTSILTTQQATTDMVSTNAATTSFNNPTTAILTTQQATTAATTSLQGTTTEIQTTDIASTNAGTTSFNNPTTDSTTATVTTSSNNFVASSTNDSSSPTSSNLPLIIGITIGSLVFVICGGSVAYLCLRKRLRRPPIDRLSTELGAFQSESSTHDVTEVQTPLSPKREENKYTVIGKRYELINKIKRSDAEILFEQTGIKVDFPENQNKVEVVLGKGQFGKLRVARMKQTGEFVGVKKIKGKAQIEASQNEAALQEVLKGKSNIMLLLDAVETKGSDDQPVLYQFMPLAGFGNGDKFKEQFMRLDDGLMQNRLLIHIARSLLTGLSHMHAAGIYHLDMKPSNFVIDNKGNVSVIDFGCAVKADNEQGKIGLSNGDSRYFSPDRLAQCRYARGIIEGGVTEIADSFSGAAADTWALGMTLYEIATNQYPFSRTSFNDKLVGADTQYFEAQLQFISELKNPEPNSYMALIKGFLDPNPQTRLTPEKALTLPIFQDPYYAFPSPGAQKAAFDHLGQFSTMSRNDSLHESPQAHLHREENENYSKTYFNRYVYSKTSIEGKYYQSPSPVTLFKPVKPETQVITTHTQAESGYDIQANARTNTTLTRSNSSD